MANSQDTPTTSKMSQNIREEEEPEEEETFYNEEDMVERSPETDIEEMRIRPEKRDRDDDDGNGEFITVAYEKKLKKEKIQVYISHKDRLPKQFALAKLLKEHSIVEITFIKYLTPFKIRIDFECEQYAQKLLTNQKLLEKGWNIQKAMEVHSSYGVIRDVDLDLSDEEIVKSISCSESVLSSAARLKRRDNNGEWVPSESVRLCFKGPRLPTYVFVDGLRIKVDRYVFPVSQCSHCWKLGHTTKRCPTNKIVCPKCGGNHVNCDIKKFRCVNCKGNHMALMKSCPEYIKEKKIRETMAEFNCIYSRARIIHDLRSGKQIINTNPKDYSQPIPPCEPEMECDPEANYETSACKPNFSHQASPVLGYRPTYANILKKSSHKKATEPYTDCSNQILNERHKRKQYKMKHNPHTSEYRSSSDNEPVNSDSNEGHSRSRESTKKSVSFKELLSRLKEIVFLRSDTLQKKVKNVIKCCIEWLILVVIDNIADWSALKSILQVING